MIRAFTVASIIGGAIYFAMGDRVAAVFATLITLVLIEGHACRPVDVDSRGPR